LKLETCFCSFIRHNTGALLVSAPLDTDGSMSTELVDLRRQVFELRQALAHVEQGRARAMFRDNKPVTGMAGTIEDITAHKEWELAQQDFRETLEGQVCERTAKLEQAITDLKKEVERRQGAESALKASEQRYQSLYEQPPFMYFTLTVEGMVLSVNSFGADQLGYRKEDLIGQSVLRLFDSRDHQTVLGQLIACAASPYTLFQWEIQKVRKDGTTLWVRERARAVHNQAKQILLISCEDITEHKRAEAALRASELRLQRFVAEAPVGLCILDESRRAISANHAFCDLTGYQEKDIIGSTYALYTHPEDLSANIVLTDEFFRGVRSEYAYEKRYIRKSGEIIWVSVKTTRIELSDHPGPLLLAAVQDITERKLAMEEREQLSRDLHDNILQALYAVGMQLEAGKLSMGKSPQRSKIHMAQAVAQLNNLMLDVRRFIALLTQRATAQPDFGQALRQLIASMSGTGQSTPELDITNPALSFITPKLGEQLLNIVREALSNSTRHARASHRWVRLSLADNAIRLIIGDNGVGFSPKRKRRLGHGLGNMATRAKQISATFTLKSAPGKGTSVLVGVPLKKGNIYE
jgi:PAS domain S-box-containing protein